MNRSPIIFGLSIDSRETLLEFATFADEHESTIRPIPLINVCEVIAIVAVIDPTKSSKGVIVEFIDEAAHACSFQVPSLESTIHIGGH